MNIDKEWLESLKFKNPTDLGEIATVAIYDEGRLQEILDGITAKENTYRENCFHVLQLICDRTPETLYPKWDNFVGLLSSANAYHRAIGLQILARLTIVDENQLFEGMFEDYFDLLDDDKVMVSRYLVLNVWRVVESKPQLLERIMGRLLAIEQTRHPESRKALLKADILEVADRYYARISDKDRLLELAEQALDSSSPKARAQAKEFILAHRK